MSLHLEKQKIPCGRLSRTARLIAIDESTGKLAVVRLSKSQETHDYIEFYNLLTGWLAVPELVVCPENGSIEHMLFTRNSELMTSHANGSVCFIDPHNSLRVKRVQVSASSIWATCAHPSDDPTKSYAALVSHSSVLYFFDVDTKKIVSSVSLGVDNRLFDVSSNGNIVAIGSIDGVILVCDGKVQQTLKLDRQNRRDPTIAWSVLFVKKSVLACGDSRGIITFWNPELGSLLQTVSCLQSHILTMCLVNEELNVSGVDPRIVVLKESSHGVYDIINRRSGPTRDVRSMAVYDNTVYAAGEDFDIYVCKNGCRKLLVQQQNNVRVSQDVVASAGDNFIDVWWKKCGEDDVSEVSQTVRQHFEMSYIAKIFTPKKRIITCWTLSECSKYLVIGTCVDTTVYQLRFDAPKLSKKVKKIHTYNLVATSFFIAKRNFLFASKGDFEIVEIDLLSHQKTERTIISQNDCGSVIKLSITSSGDFLSLLTTRSQIFCVNSDTGSSRLVKVDLPIDLTCTLSSVIVLTSHPAFSDNADTKKIFHEVTLSTGAVKRSASSHQLRMVPTSPKSVFPGQPVSLLKFGSSQILASSYDGHWSIVDVVSNSLVSALDGPMKAKKDRFEESGIVIAGVRNNEKDNVALGNKRKIPLSDDSINFSDRRLVMLDAYADELPKTSGFKLKTFGMQ